MPVVPDRPSGRGKRGRGSLRGASPRPRGPKLGSTRGRGSKSKVSSVAAAAAAAAAAAGAAAAYAAHGYSFQATGPQYGSNSTSSK